MFKLLHTYLIDTSQASNIRYLRNFGSLLTLCLVIQIITGITLVIHYNITITNLEIVIIEAIKTLFLSMFTWFLVISLILLLTKTTLNEVRKDNIGIFFSVLIVICIGTYTDIFHYETIHCAGSSIDLNLADKSKEIVTEALPNTIKSTVEGGFKSTNLYDLPKKRFTYVSKRIYRWIL